VDLAASAVGNRGSLPLTGGRPMDRLESFIIRTPKSDPGKVAVDDRT
jgi:hypothetical protein